MSRACISLQQHQPNFITTTIQYLLQQKNIGNNSLQSLNNSISPESNKATITHLTTMDSPLTTSTRTVSKAIITLQRSTTAMSPAIFSRSTSPTTAASSSQASVNPDSTDLEGLVPSSHGYGIAIWFGLIVGALALILIFAIFIRRRQRAHQQRWQATWEGRLWLSLKRGWKKLEQKLGLARGRRAGASGRRRHRGWYRLNDDSRSSEQEGTELGNMGR